MAGTRSRAISNESTARVSMGTEANGWRLDFRALVDSLVEPVIVVDRQGGIVFCNRATGRILGRQTKELINQPIAAIAPEVLGRLDAVLMRGAQAHGAENGGGEHLLLDVLRADGQYVSFDATLAPTVIDNDDAVVIVGRIDATPQDIPAPSVELSAHSADVTSANTNLAVIHAISAALTSSSNIEATLPAVLEALVDVEALGLDRRGALFIVRDGQIALTASIGAGECAAGGCDRLPLGACLCGRVAKTGQPIVNVDAAHDTRHITSGWEMPAHGHVVIPLRAGDRTVGVMCLYTSSGAAIEPSTLNTLLIVGHQIGMAIESAHLYEEARILSLHDPLTGLGNRRLLQIAMDRCLSQARRTLRPFSVLMIDIDDFKPYNDTLGHEAGDRALQQVAAVISRNTRQMDLAVRYGGDEITVLLPDAGVEIALHAAERLSKQVDQETDLRISIGVACFDPKTMVDESDVLRAADTALYAAKARGRGRTEVADETLPTFDPGKGI